MDQIWGYPMRESEREMAMRGSQEERIRDGSIEKFKQWETLPVAKSEVVCSPTPAKTESYLLRHGQEQSTLRSVAGLVFNLQDLPPGCMC
jgi:hypothetical protein